MIQGKRPVVGILVFDRVEALDFAGPYEVFAAAKDERGSPYFDTLLVAREPEVRCSGGLRVLANATFDTCPRLDILIVPGGPGARDSAGQERMIQFVQEQNRTVETIASVCTGAFILARSGLLHGRKATTHRQRLDQFKQEFPDIQVVAAKLVDEGHMITAAGVSSGIDLALHILERRFGLEARQREARRLDGPWI